VLTVKFKTKSGCEVEKKVDAYYIVKKPDVMSLTAVANAKVCENEKYEATFTIENGVPENDEPRYLVEGLPNGINPIIDEDKVTVNVPAGDYNLIVTDANKCSAHVAFRVDEIVVDKPEISFTPVCDDQTVDLAIKNQDDTKYTYSWSLPKVTGLSKTDDGKKYTLTASAKELPTNNIACTKSSEELTISFLKKPVLSWISNNTSGTVCPKESGAYPLGVVAENTDSNESYAWSVTGGTIDKNNTDNVNFTPTNRCSGNATYEVLVENENGCQSRISGSFEINAGDLTFSLPDNLKTVALTSTNCKFTVPDLVGDASYNVAKSTRSCHQVSYTQSIESGTPVTSSTNVTITAKDFCHVNGIYQIVNLTVPTQISIESVSSTPVKCKGDSDGSIAIGNVVGGKENFRYYYKKASDDEFTNLTGKTVSNLLAGDYVLRVVDANGCSNNKSVSVKEPSIVTISATPTNAVCHGTNGKITVAANGGNGGSYIYKYGTSSDNITTLFTSDSELPANKYYVQAFDSKGCKSAVADVTITQPDDFNPGTIESTGQQICYGFSVNAINSVEVATSIPSATISYRWMLEQNGEKTEIDGATDVSYTPDVTAPGTYTYYREAKDDKCKTTWTESPDPWTLVINQNPVVTLSVPSDVCAKVDGKYPITVSVEDQPGDYTYSYKYSNNVTVDGSNISVVAANKCGGDVSYNVEVTNSTTGCKSTDSKMFSITTPTIAFTDAAKEAAKTHIQAEPKGDCTFAIPALDNVVYQNICEVNRPCHLGDVTYSIKENISGHTILDNLVEITIVASDVCVSDEITVYVDKPEPLILSGSVNESPICKDATTSVILTASGGSAPYVYNLVSPSEMPSGMTIDGNEASGVKPGNYTFSVLDADGCVANTALLNVVTFSEFKTNPSLERTGQDICSEETPYTIKVVNAESNGGAVTYMWYKNEVIDGNRINGATSNEWTPDDNFVDVGPTQRRFDYIAVVTDQCSGKEIRLRYSLTVNPNPVVNLTASNGCESSIFRADVNGVTNNYNFYWSETNQDGSFVLGTSTKTVSLPTALDQLAKTYYVKTENAITKCASKQSVSKTVTVYRKPSISIGEIAVVCPKTPEVSGSEVVIPVSSVVGGVVSVTEGDANVAYTYSDGKITLTENIATGKDFTITVKNGDVCESVSEDVSVFVYSAPDFDLTDWDDICQGNPMHSLPEVPVVWNDNAADKNKRSEGWYNGSTALTADDIKNLSVGNHIFTYKAVNGCGLSTDKNIPFVVNQNPTLDASIVEGYEYVCGNNGQIKISTSGGTAPYSYTINGVSYDLQNDGKVSGLAPNNYSIEVVDINGCEDNVDGLIIRHQAQFNEGSLNPIAPICANEDVTPVISFKTLPSGGSGEFVYNWFNGNVEISGATESSYTPSLPKESMTGKYVPGTYTYTVTVTDQKGSDCGYVSHTATIVVKPQPAVTLKTSSAKSCDEDIVFTAEPSGAKTGVGYLYKWDNEAYGDFKTKTLTLPLSIAKTDATYKVVVKADGCESEPASASAAVYASPELGEFSLPEDLCANKVSYNVSVNLNSNKGYTRGDNIYTWKVGNQTFGTSSSVVVPVKNSCGDVYNFSVSVKNVESECESVVKLGSFSTSIDEPTIKNATEIDPILLTDGVSCKFAVPFDKIKTAVGLNTSCDLIASEWSFMIDGTEVNSETRIDSDKDVLVTVTDACNRSVHTTVQLKVPSPLIWNGTQSVVDVDCKGDNNGQISLSVAGGVAPYAYAKTSLDVNAAGWQTSGVFTGLSASTYTMSAKDANGCKIEKNLTVSEPANPLTGTIAGNATVCKDTKSPVTVTVSGGTAPYVVTVGGDTKTGNDTQTEFSFDLPAGTYVAEITDAKSCHFVTSTSAIINEYVDLKTAIQFTNNPASQTICEGAIKNKITVSATSYSSADDALTYIWKINNGDVLSNHTSEHTPLETAVGVYDYTVSVVDGCTKKTYTVDKPYRFTINKKPTAKIKVPEENNCEGSSVVLSVETNRVDGENYTFEWNDPDKSTTESLTVSKDGNYVVKVTLGNCSASDKKQVKFGSRPANPTLTITKETSCEESIIFTASGAKPGETYVWKHNGEPKDMTSSTTQIDYVGGESVTGSWTVSIKNDIGCESEKPATKTATIYKKPTFEINVPTNACPIDDSYPLSIDVGYAAGGNYSVKWSNNVVPDNQVAAKAVINKKTDVCGSTYSFDVTVTDAHCQTTKTGSFVTKKSTASDLSLTINPNVHNLTGTDCVFKVPNVITGYTTFSTICDVTKPTTITQSVAEGEVIDGSKTITVTATDFCGTSITENVTLNVPVNELTGKILDATVTNVMCSGENDGKVTLSVDGLNGSGYTYCLTDNGQYNVNSDNGEFIKVPFGTYTASVKDKNGCMLNNPTVKVSQPEPLSATIPTTLSVCPGSSDGSIEITNISGGTAPYTVTVTNATASVVSEGKSIVSGLAKGSYSIKVSDKNGCEKEETLVVTEYEKPSVNIEGEASVCEGDFVKLDAKSNANAAPTVIYSWVKSDVSPDDSEYSIFNAGASKTVAAPASTEWNGRTVYSETWYVKIKDGHGCVSDATSATATIMKKPEVTLDKEDVVLCYDKTTTISANDVAGYTYTWMKNGSPYGDNSASITTDNEHGVTTYSLTVFNGTCTSDPKTVSVTQPSSDLSLVHVESNPSAYGLNDGSFTITVDGGYGGYKYCIMSTANEECTPETEILETAGKYEISVSDVAAGEYYYTIADKQGCKDTVLISIVNEGAPNIDWSTTDALCNKDNSDDDAKFGIITATSSYKEFTLKMKEPSTGYVDVVSTEEGGMYVAGFTGLPAGVYTVEYVLNENPDITKEETFTITEPDLFTFSLDYGTGTAPCDMNYNEVVISKVSGGSAFDVTDPSKNYFDDKYEVAYSDNETEATVSYVDGKFALSGDISTAKLTAELTDKNGCVARNIVEYKPSDSDLKITCDNLKGMFVSFDDNCTSAVSLTADDIKDSVNATLCAPNTEVKVKYSLDNGATYNDMPFNHTLTKAENELTVLWKFYSDEYPSIVSEPCSHTIKGKDDKSPVFTAGDLDKTINYSDQNKTCGANYTNDDVEALLGIEDCSLKEVSYCLRKKGETQCLSSGKVFEDGSYKSISTEDLLHGEYEIVYAATDGTNEPTNKIQNITIIDDIAPEIACPNKTIEIPMTNGSCQRTIDLDKQQILNALRAEKVGVATDASGNEVNYDMTSDKYETSILSADNEFTAEDQNKINVDCGDDLTIEYEITNYDVDGNETGTETGTPSSTTIKKGETQKISVLVSDAHNQSSTCEISIKGVDVDPVFAESLKDETLVIDGKTDGKTCEADTLFSFDKVKNELVKTDNCAGVEKISYQIKDSENNVVADGIMTNASADITEWLSKGDYTVSWTATDGDGKTYPSVEQKITVEDGVAPAINCADVEIPIDANCEASVDMNLHQFALGYLADKIVVDETTGEISAKNSGDEEYFKLSDDKKTITNIYDECKNDLSIKVSETDAVGDEDHLIVSLDKDNQTKDVYWTLSDGTNNSEQCKSVISAIDNADPEVKTPDAITVHTSSSADKCVGDTTIANDAIKAALDIKECSEYTISYSVDGESTNPLTTNDVVANGLTPGEHEISYTVTDATGKSTTVTQTVTVVDNVAPIIACPSDFDIFVKDLANGCQADTTVTVQMLKNAYVNANAASATEITTTTNENNTPYAYTKDGDGNVDKVYDECGKELSFYVGLTDEEEKSSVDVNVSLNDNDSYVYWTLKDEFGNTSRCSTLVSPKDTAKPEIAESLDILKLQGVDSDSKCQGVSDLSYTEISDMLDIKDCSNTEISYVIVHEDGTKSDAKIVENDPSYKFNETLNDGDVIEWIVTDEFQNADTVQQNVEIIDRIAPKINCAELVKNITISEAEIAAGICVEDDYLINHKGLFTGLKKPTDNSWVKDNCTDFEDIVVTSKRSDGKNNGDQADLSAHFMVGSTTVIWTFTDKAGNYDFCPQVVNIINNPPTIVCEPSVVKVPITRTNNCDKSYKIDPDKVIADLRRGVLIEKSIIDADGNILNGMSDSEIDELLHKSDCGHDLMLDYSSDVSIDNDGSFTFENGEDVEISYRVYDEYGNESFCTITYKPVDEEAPYVSKDEFSSTLVRGTDCKYTYSNTKSDFLSKLDAADCSDMKVYYEIDGKKTELTDKMTYNGFDSEIGEETINWTIEDEFGNNTEVTETVNKIDTIAPSIACPTEPIRLPLANDCHARVSMSSEQIVAMMRAGAVLTEISDDSLKKIMGVDLFDKLEDAEKSAVTHDCGETLDLYVVNGDTYYEKNDGIDLDLQYGESVTLEFAVRDLSGNESKCELAFMATDTTAPKIDAMEKVELYYKESECKCTYASTYEDVKNMLNIRDCDDNTIISYIVDGETKLLAKGQKMEDISLVDKEVKNIQWIVTDNNGNESVTNQEVVAYDNIAPQFKCNSLPSELVVELHNHGDEATFEKFKEAGLDTSIRFDDSCDGMLKPLFTRDDDKSVFDDIYPANDTTILYTTFTDKASNSQTCEQKLIVKDLIKPQIICPQYDTFVCIKTLPYIAKNIEEFKTYLYGKILDEQNVVPDKLTYNDDVVGDNCESTTIRTYTIYDKFGGSSSCSSKIYFKDTIPPGWETTLEKDTLYMICGNPSPEWKMPTAEDDDCNYNQSTYVNIERPLFSTQVDDETQCGHYNYEVTYVFYAVDGCGNETPKEDRLKLVMVNKDDNKPKFDVPDWFESGDVYAISEGNCEMLMPDMKPFTSNWSDPCQAAKTLTFTQSPAAGTVITDNTTVMMALSDACGNTFTYEKEVTVPKREDIVTAMANDFAKCEGTESDVTLMSESIISAVGKSNVLQDDNTYKEVESNIVFDVYKGSIAVPNLVYSNNKTTFGLRFSSNPDKVAEYTAIDKLTQTGTYYYVAQDMKTGCADTASAYIGIRQRPRVAMSSVDTVEACEYQALAVNGMAGDYKDILNVCVEDMGSEIIEEGWMIGGAKYNGEPISHIHDGTRMIYYAVNECGMTSSDNSSAWRCDYVYNSENGTFVSDLTTAQMMNDVVSNGAPMRVHQKISPDSMLLTAIFEGRSRVWVGESVSLDMKSIYKDKGIEYHWYQVVGDVDVSSQMFDGFGNVLEDYINPLDDADELLAVSSISDPDFGSYFYENLLDTTLFYVVVTDNVCTSAASNVVEVDAYDFIPTAITPHNSVGMNDVFMPGFQVEIFNRYGNKVFEGEDGWDGTIRGELADPTVYYYVITMKDGSTRKGSVEVVYFK